MILRLLTTLLVLGWAPWALAEGGEDFQLGIHGFYVVDFVVYLALMGFLFKRPATAFLEERHHKARVEMEEAAGVRATAEERVGRYEGLLGGLESEIAELREEFAQDGHREGERISETAAAAADKLRQDGARALARDQSMSIDDLQRDLAEKAMVRAEELIRERLDTHTQQALIRSFIEDLDRRTSLNTTA